jgi:DtxR family Mn-dependent transcriptional regulator
MARRTKSAEDYLEAIAILEETGEVTVTGLSRFLGVKKSSVNAAISRLATDGLVTHQKYGPLQLTKKGEEIARDIYWRHKLLRHFFRDVLNIDSDIANDEACKVEHCLSRESLEKLDNLIKEIEWSRS